MSKFVRSVALVFILTATACSSPAADTPTPLPPTATAVPSTPTRAVTNTPAPTATITPTPGPSLTPTRGPSPTPGPKENLLAAFNTALSKIKTFRVKVILDPSQQDNPERIIEVILPDRFRQIQENDVRQIGNKVYFFEPAPRVITIGGLMPFFDRINLSSYRDQFNQAAQTSFLGRAVVDGNQLVGYQTTVKYQNLNSSNRETFGKITDEQTKVWFSPQSGFPVRIEVGNPILFINLYYDFNGTTHCQDVAKCKVDEIGPP